MGDALLHILPDGVGMRPNIERVAPTWATQASPPSIHTTPAPTRPDTPLGNHW